MGSVFPSTLAPHTVARWPVSRSIALCTRALSRNAGSCPESLMDCTCCDTAAQSCFSYLNQSTNSPKLSSGLMSSLMILIDSIVARVLNSNVTFRLTITAINKIQTKPRSVGGIMVVWSTAMNPNSKSPGIDSH